MRAMRVCTETCSLHTRVLERLCPHTHINTRRVRVDINITRQIKQKRTRMRWRAK